MKVGLELGSFAWDGGPAAMADTVGAIARSADDAGFSLIGIGDHLWQGPHSGGPEEPYLECFTTLGVIAGQTRRCRLAPIVAGVHFRYPSVLAKMITSLDVLSGGRAVLGIGAGWDADEATGMGIPFPPVAQRFDMLEEAIRICLALWSGDEQPFHGTHYTLERPLNVPNSLSRPHPPILIGGGGERRTLRLVARYADACNLYPTPDLADKLDVLRRHCDAEGRDYDAIEKTCIMPFDLGADGSAADGLVELLQGLSGLGIQTMIGIIGGTDPARQVDLIGTKVIPAVTDF